jgi:hypothetical protein
MRPTHAAAAYDKWFRAEVAEGIKEADDPAAQWVSNEDANKSWAKPCQSQANRDHSATAQLAAMALRDDSLPVSAADGRTLLPALAAAPLMAAPVAGLCVKAMLNKSPRSD